MMSRPGNQQMRMQNLILNPLGNSQRRQIGMITKILPHIDITIDEGETVSGYV